MTIRVLGMGTALLLAACGSGGGDADATAAPAAERAYDLAGVSVGMKEADAEAVLRKSGWKVERFSGPTWDEEVAFQAGIQRGAFVETGHDGIGGFNASKGDESILVKVRPSPDGAQVKSVDYDAPLAGTTFAQFQADLERRYGKPTIAPQGGMQGYLTYCGSGEPRCIHARGAGTKPILQGIMDSTERKLSLREGTVVPNGLKTRLDAAIRAKLGGGKSSF